MGAPKFSKIPDFSQKWGSPSTKKHPFLKNQVQILKMGHLFMKIRGWWKLGPVVEKFVHVDEKFSSKIFFIFVKKMSSKLAKIGVTKMSSFGPHIPRETRIFFNIFHENSGRKTSKKAPKFPGNPYILANLGPKFTPKLSKFPSDEISSKIVKNGRKWPKMAKNGPVYY